MAERSVEELESARRWPARRKRLVPILLLCIAGGVLIALPGEDVPVTAVGVFLLSAAAVWALALFFYEIGIAEDLERARTGVGSPYDRPLEEGEPPTRTVPPEDRPAILDPPPCRDDT